ncbi:S9 family peptidase [Ruminococcaceae bacterium OttesenSCG-928-O06]|nr:S9 family peptidase [Ruminococcaceae bacterium OttesenSCG-928-O06]
MKQVEADHFTRFAFPTALRANASGALAFRTKRANMQENRYDTSLWLYRGGTLCCLSENGGVQGHWWAGADTLILARPGDEADKARAAQGLPFTLLQALPVNGPGEARELARLYMEVEDVLPLPGGRLLLHARCSADAEAALQEAGGDVDAAAALLVERAACTVVEELPFWENGAGYTSRVRRRLYVLENGTATALTDAATEVAAVYQVPGGACFVAKRYTARAPVEDGLFFLDETSLEIKERTFAAPFRHDGVAALPDGELLVLGSDMKEYGINQNPAFYRLAPGGTTTCLYKDGLYSAYNGVGSDLSMAAYARPVAARGQVYFVSTLGEDSHLFFIDGQSGGITQCTVAPGAVAEVAAAGNELYFIAMRGVAGPEVYRLCPDGSEEAVTAFNTHLQKEYAYAALTPVAFANREGTEIRGFVLRPPTLAEGARCPAILNVHGGPKMAYGSVLFHEMQYWAAQGFAVLFCNPTGGDGRGDKFADVRGRYGEIDYEDLMAFTDAALAACPFIDPTRLGITGGSYGGFMTNWVVGHTHRFKAAASQRGIANWGSMACISDIGYYFEPDQTAATLWTDADKVWRQSPLRYADKVKTPVLFIHSEEDYRCPLPEALQMYGALQDFGVPTRLCIFAGENHELSRSGKPKNRLRRLQEITGWFQRYLLG